MILKKFKGDLRAWSNRVEWSWPAQHTKLKENFRKVQVYTTLKAEIYFQYKTYVLTCACPTSSAH